MFKTIAAIILIILSPVLLKATNHSFFSVKGTWFIYGVAVYPCLDRVVVKGNNHQAIYKPSFNFGGGVGKDNLRFEFTQYLEYPRVLAAWDLLPNSLGSPYIGCIYSKGLKNMSKENKTMKQITTRFDVVLGMSFQPIRFLSVYTEYLVKDSYFFLGFRLKLPYTIN